MLLTVLAVPDCPNVAVLLDLLDEILGARSEDLAVIVVGDETQAQAWGMTGSPTLLVDGRDPFAAATEVAASLSCRLYPGAGVLAGTPSAEDLRAVFAAAETAVTPKAVAPVLALDRGGRRRRAPVERGLRAVQQALLGAIARWGCPPGAAELDRVAGRFGRTGVDVLTELAAEDYVQVDADGKLRAAYPFSIGPSRHRLHMPGGRDAWAVDAVDALGVAPMTGESVLIESADALTGHPIVVHASVDTTARAEPAGTVIHLGGRRDDQPSAVLDWDAMHFFASPHSALRWGAQHSAAQGQIIDLTTGSAIGRAFYGDLLNM